MKVVGVESGGHAGFPRAPYYDREAVAPRQRCQNASVADYSLADRGLLPVGRVHLATLHLMLEGEPDFELRLITATTPEGSAIDALISFADLNDNPQERVPIEQNNPTRTLHDDLADRRRVPRDVHHHGPAGVIAILRESPC